MPEDFHKDRAMAASLTRQDMAQPLPPCTCHLRLINGDCGECEREIAREARRVAMDANAAATGKCANFRAEREPGSPKSDGSASPLIVANQPGQELVCCPVVAGSDGEVINDLSGECEVKLLRAGSKERRGSKGERRRPSKTTIGEPVNVTRKVSKSSAFWHRSKTRTETFEALENVESPDFMWNTYLQHFPPEQLDWISVYFEQLDAMQEGRIPTEEGIDIAIQWCGRFLTLVEPVPHQGLIDDALAECTRDGHASRHMSFEHLVRFVRVLQTKALENDENAGFGEDEMDDLSDAFMEYSTEKVQRNSLGNEVGAKRRSLSTLETFNVLEFLGRQTSSPNEQTPVVELIKQVDKDKSGDLDYLEYLQLMRKVRMIDAVADRAVEHRHIIDCGLTDQEVEQFQELFLQFQSEEGTINTDDLRTMMWSLPRIAYGIDIKAEELNKDQKKHIIEVVDTMGVEDLTFGEFLQVIRKLMDEDFCDMRRKSEEQLQIQEEDRRFMSPEDWAAKYQMSPDAFNPDQKRASWVARMNDTKQRVRSSLKASDVEAQAQLAAAQAMATAQGC